MSNEGQDVYLDNRLVAPYFPPAYYLAMTGIAFQQRVKVALKEKGMSKADLHRKSGVPYHAIDKFLKRDNATTSSENAVAIADALGINVDSGAEYDELRVLYDQLDEETQKVAQKILRGLAK